MSSESSTISDKLQKLYTINFANQSYHLSDLQPAKYVIHIAVFCISLILFCSKPLVLDKSRGRAQIRDGRIIYSPNSNRNVDIPPRIPHDRNPFYPDCKSGTKKRNFWKLDVSAYEKPQWYHIKFGWICCYDKNVLYSTSPLLNVLRYSSSRFVFDEEECKFTLSPLEKNDWLGLENQLVRAYATIHHHYPVHAFSPSNPYVFGYLCAHKSQDLLSLSLQKSKAWFGLWLAILSFNIAVAECTRASLDDSSPLKEPPWQDLILEYGEDLHMDRVWLDMLLDTHVANFSPDVSRVGTFIMLGAVEVYDVAPSVDWFMKYGVPVWYEWSAAHASQVHYQRFAPLEYQLQEATTFRTKSPSLATSTPTTNYSSTFEPFSGNETPLTSRPPTPDQDLRIPSRTNYMDEFFNLRTERIARILEIETSQQRQCRLSRAAQPPTKNARVFEWTQSASGEYTYEEIRKNLRIETLDYYSSEQRRYEPVLNEWHCCELWGDFERDDEDDFNFLYDGDHRPVEEAVAPPNSNLPFDDAPVDDLLPDRNSDDTLQQPLNIRLLALQDEILTIASLYFGYTPRIPLRSVAVLEEKKRMSFCRSFGLIWDQVKSVEEIFTLPSAAAAIEFFQQLATKNSVLKDDEWDLCKNNPFPVFMSPRFRQFRLLQTTTSFRNGLGLQSKDVTIYMLDLGPKSVAPWKLAMKNALDALLVCRLDHTFNEYHIAEYLLTNGIPFHTLQPSSTVKRTPDIHRLCLLPFRRPDNYKYESRDYLAYRQRCHSILSHSRGRAALMHGHFMWRLALRSVRFEAVFNGPSGWSPNPDEMLIVYDRLTGIEYLDDKLSADEQEALCGTYHCLTGEQFI
jgi:hypothetical protein